MIIKANIASGWPDINGDILTKPEQWEMAKTAVGKKITFNFTPPELGHIEAAAVEEDGVWVVGTLDVRANGLLEAIKNGKFYAVPGLKGSGEVREISLVMTPADTTLPPVTLENNDER